MKKRRIVLILSSLLVTNIFPIIGYSLELNQLEHGNRRDEESKLTSTFDSLIESNQTQESSEDLSISSSGETTDNVEAEVRTNKDWKMHQFLRLSCLTIPILFLSIKFFKHLSVLARPYWKMGSYCS